MWHWGGDRGVCTGPAAGGTPEQGPVLGSGWELSAPLVPGLGAGSGPRLDQCPAAFGSASGRVLGSITAALGRTHRRANTAQEVWVPKSPPHPVPGCAELPWGSPKSAEDKPDPPGLATLRDRCLLAVPGGLLGPRSSCCRVPSPAPRTHPVSLLAEGGPKKLRSNIRRSTETGIAVEMRTRVTRQGSRESTDGSTNSNSSDGT